MDLLNISDVIGDGLFPDEDKVVAFWPASPAETPIRIALGPVRGALKPNTDTVMPANVAQMLLESGYDVQIKYRAIVNPDVDAFVDEALSPPPPPAAPDLSDGDDTIAGAAMTDGNPALAGESSLIDAASLSAFDPADIIKLPVAKLKEAIASLDADALAAVLDAELAEGPGKTRSGALDAIKAAMAALNQSEGS